MQKAKFEKINMTAMYAGFRSKEAVRRITPLYFTQRSGEKHEIAQIKRSYCEHVGDGMHIHFVVRTRRNRYFDVVYDSRALTWDLVLELEDF